MLMRQRSAGFTLIELIITVSIAALLIAAAIPAIGNWMNNAKVRSTAESLQNSVRLAQAEAISRGQQTVLVLTSSAPAWNSTPVANGKNWAVHAQPLANSVEAAATASATTHPYIDGSTYATRHSIAITGPALLCFNSSGRMVSATSVAVPNAGTATCTSAPATYEIKHGTTASVDRTYKVIVSLGGKVRMCDANKTLSSSNPDGC